VLQKEFGPEGGINKTQENIPYRDDKQFMLLHKTSSGDQIK